LVASIALRDVGAAFDWLHARNSGVARLDSRVAGETEARELCGRSVTLEEFVEQHLRSITL